jgi:hypothetical protein
MELRGQTAYEEGQAFVYWCRLDHMVVVEDEHDLIGEGLEFVYERGNHFLTRGDIRGTQEREGHLTDARSRTIKRRDHVTPEPDWVVVVRIEREPGHRPLRALGPVGEQGRLSEPSRGTHQHQIVHHALVEPHDQA